MTDGPATPWAFGGTLASIVKGSLIRAFLAVAVALVGLAGIAPPVAMAATCTGGTITQVCNGTVAPAVGTTSTTFTFSVVYQDSKSRTPCFVRVTIAGVGTFDMAPACSTVPSAALANGTTFTYTTKLPVGAYTYSFAGGHGGTTRVISNPTPSPVTVTAPTPTPTPIPTPKPTPRPTPVPTPRPTPHPTPRPTPRPTPKATPKTTPKPTPKPGKTPRPTPSSGSPSPDGQPAASASPSASPLAGGGFLGGDPGEARSGSGGPGGGSPGGAVVILSLITTGFGLSGGVVLLSRRRRRAGPDGPDPEGDSLPPRSPAPSPGRATARPPSPSSARPAQPVPAVAPAPALGLAATGGTVAWIEPGEAGVPRWRRSSLKEARAKSDRAAALAHQSVTFGSSAQPGVERSVVRYDLVPLLDQPDEVTGLAVGDLQAGDEVDAIGKRGVWTEVRTPRGAVGWVHRTTLQPLAMATSDDFAADHPASPTPVDTADDDLPEPDALDRMLARIVADREVAAEVATRSGDRPAPEPTTGPPPGPGTRTALGPTGPLRAISGDVPV